MLQVIKDSTSKYLGIGKNLYLFNWQVFCFLYCSVKSTKTKNFHKPMLESENTKKD